ncbi:MAG: hypothetical protein ACTSVI_04725 [Promethearchaeota archaeon]
MDLLRKDSYQLNRFAKEYESFPIVDEIKVHVLKTLIKSLPKELTIDVYGWGPFKQLVLKRS